MSALAIGWTWDGRPLPAEERAAVRLVPEGDDLQLQLLAPLAHVPPPPGPPGPTPGLWEHEVVELFLAGDGPAYLEVEIGPHGHHLVLHLADVRRPVATGLPLACTTASDADAWAADARLPAAWLPPRPWRAAAFRVRPGADPPHLASLPLPGPRADFHQPHRFPALALGNPDDDGLVELLAALRPDLAAAARPAAIAARATGGADPLPRRLLARRALLHSASANRPSTG